MSIFKKSKKNEQEPTTEHQKKENTSNKNVWTCKKCKTENTKNSMYCKDCGDYK